MVIPSSIRKLGENVMDVGRERALKNRQVRPDTIGGFKYALRVGHLYL